MADDEHQKKKTVRRRRAAIAGMLLAIACQFAPENYRAACEAIAALCTGGH